MPFGPVNPIDIPYDQHVYNYTHPRKPGCSVSYGHGHIARGSGQLNRSKDRCVVNHVSYGSMERILLVPLSVIKSVTVASWQSLSFVAEDMVSTPDFRYPDSPYMRALPLVWNGNLERSAASGIALVI
ncbi:hypothetical protein AVEN_16293-1 [Araneus ventricosus]|uniref:Uncharacterized protein n=1 Tax=Araneus ventricosus TaxID=182803 RepID=A0A4Y2VQ35_ARAVE|nr:hypothetical protein AVEN_16293-1 [Araneus ventricosus]